ncbi:MAG TPA: dockerin type I domain-containing protein, partial [Tepidisphaeraceae bacterium]
AAGGTLSIQAANFTNTGILAVNSGILQVTSNLTTSAANLLITGGTLKIGAAAGAGAGKTVLRIDGPLTITGGGAVDLGNNQLIVDYDPAAASPIASIRAALESGYAGGSWNGPGIASAGIAAGRSLGYAEAAEALGAAGGNFAGQSVDGSAVLVRYTLTGDANLDGVVDFLDLARLAQSYNVTDGKQQWSSGDNNYDGNVDFLDLAALAQNYNTGLPSASLPGAASAEFEADLARAFANVPEPTGLLAFVALSMLTWRSRRRLS